LTFTLDIRTTPPPSTGRLFPVTNSRTALMSASSCPPNSSDGYRRKLTLSPRSLCHCASCV
jgi:hypothetical protein